MIVTAKKNQQTTKPPQADKPAPGTIPGLQSAAAPPLPPPPQMQPHIAAPTGQAQIGSAAPTFQPPQAMAQPQTQGKTSQQAANQQQTAVQDNQFGNSDPGGTNAGEGGDPSDFQAQWGQMQQDWDAGLQGELEGTMADEARAGRMNSEMNAASGGGMGGAFAGGQAQVALGGMQQRLQARNQHLKQGMEMKMTVLQNYIKQAMQDKDIALQKWLQTEADNTAMALAQANAEAGQANTDSQMAAMGFETDEQKQNAVDEMNSGDQSNWWNATH